jgi:UPF0755 protein
MTLRKTSPVKPISIVILIIFCLGATVFLWSLDAIPRWAEAEFGAGTSNLNILQRWTYSIQLLLNKEGLKNAVNPNGGEQSFVIASGESADSVALRLKQEGLISDAEIFRLYLIYSGADRYLKAGSFRLSSAQTPVNIALALQDSTLMEVDFIILPGWRLEEVAGALPTSGIDISPEEFLALVRNPLELEKSEKIGSPNTLEGFLYPDTYVFSRQISPGEMAETILQRFDEVVNTDMITAFDRQGLTLYEAVILASIVEREAMVDDEQSLIASVFLNRLRAGMKLDSDPTVQYAVGFNNTWNSWWKNPLSYEDLQIESPFNTYQNIGLPPNPISNPGLSALLAVAYPAESPYYYFRAKCDGSGRHNFSTTYEEHLQYGCP